MRVCHIHAALEPKCESFLIPFHHTAWLANTYTTLSITSVFELWRMPHITIGSHYHFAHKTRWASPSLLPLPLPLTIDINPNTLFDCAISYNNKASQHTAHSEIIMIRIGAPTFQGILTLAIQPSFFPLTFHRRSARYASALSLKNTLSTEVIITQKAHTFITKNDWKINQ